MAPSPIVNEIISALKLLNANNPFVNFNFELSTTEINAIKNIRVTNTKVYDNFGRLDLFTTELNEFIKSLNQNNKHVSNCISILMNKLVHDVVLGFEKETAWVSVRASNETNLWDIPRWHTDGYYYSPYIGAQYKVVITLKGPSSLFYPLPDETRKNFYALQFDPENREKIANMLDPSQSVSAIGHQGTIYIVGTSYAAVHSEPPIHEERLFLSILPGNQSEIQELANNWNASNTIFSK